MWSIKIWLDGMSTRRGIETMSSHKFDGEGNKGATCLALWIADAFFFIESCQPVVEIG